MEESALLRFYRGAGPDHRGRRLDDVLAFDEARLESTHDYIQWLFPLPEPSGANARAPLLSAADREAFATDPALRAALVRSLDAMLAFYGLERRGGPGGGSVVRGPRYGERSADWLGRPHNFLRVSRILRSLALLGCAPEARALLGCLEGIRRENAEAIGEETLGYWRRAAAG